MEELTLTQKEFKALSSEKRTQIIKMLKGRNYTLAEFSKHLNLAPPTIKQHLELLIDSDIIELEDSGHKWKYYKLTRKGKKLTESEENRTTLLIVLAISVISMVGIAMLLASNLGLTGKIGATGVQESQMPMQIAQPQMQKTVEGEKVKEAAIVSKAVEEKETERQAAVSKAIGEKEVAEESAAAKVTAAVPDGDKMRITERAEEKISKELVAPKEEAKVVSATVPVKAAAEVANSIAIAAYLVVIVALLLVSANIAKKLFGGTKL